MSVTIPRFFTVEKGISFPLSALSRSGFEYFRIFLAAGDFFSEVELTLVHWETSLLPGWADRYFKVPMFGYGEFGYGDDLGLIRGMPTEAFICRAIAFNDWPKRERVLSNLEVRSTIPFFRDTEYSELWTPDDERLHKEALQRQDRFLEKVKQYADTVLKGFPTRVNKTATQVNLDRTKHRVLRALLKNERTDFTHQGTVTGRWSSKDDGHIRKVLSRSAMSALCPLPLYGDSHVELEKGVLRGKCSGFGIKDPKTGKISLVFSSADIPSPEAAHQAMSVALQEGAIPVAVIELPSLLPKKEELQYKIERLPDLAVPPVRNITSHLDRPVEPFYLHQIPAFLTGLAKGTYALEGYNHYFANFDVASNFDITPMLSRLSRDRRTLFVPVWASRILREPIVKSGTNQSPDSVDDADGCAELTPTPQTALFLVNTPSALRITRPLTVFREMLEKGEFGNSDSTFHLSDNMQYLREPLDLENLPKDRFPYVASFSGRATHVVQLLPSNGSVTVEGTSLLADIPDYWRHTLSVKDFKEKLENGHVAPDHGTYHFTNLVLVVEKPISPLKLKEKRLPFRWLDWATHVVHVFPED